MKYKELQDFYHNFAFKTIIYDPLDREIWYEDESESDEDSDGGEDKQNGEGDDAEKNEGGKMKN